MPSIKKISFLEDESLTLFPDIRESLKKLVSIALLTAVLLNVFSKGVIYLQYQLNKSYISQNLCENKAKKTMKCEGKCHLKKQLEKDSQQEKAPSRNSLKEKMDVQFFLERTAFVLRVIDESISQSTSYSFSLSTASRPSIFHPPA